MALKKVKLGDLLELCDERNSDLKYDLSDVRGISIKKVFIDTKADMEGVSLKPYILVKPDSFAYVKERREEEKKKAKPIFTFNMVLEEIKDIRTKKVCFDVADNGIEYECHVVAELENSDHALFEVKRIFHDGKWNEIEGNTVVLPNKTVYFDFRFNDDVNNLFLEVKDGLDNSYYYEIKVLSLNLLPGVVRNSNTELLHTVRELKEISIDEINKRTTKR